MDYLEDIAEKEYEARKLGRSRIDLIAFKLGWIAYQQWEEEQKEMSRDYQEELNQQQALRERA
jgi:hypothetical protein